MWNRSLTTVLAAALIVAGSTIVSGNAFAQDAKAKAAAEQKKAPGKACSDVKPNSQEHKDCIAKQAKGNQAKGNKEKEEKPAKKS